MSLRNPLGKWRTPKLKIVLEFIFRYIKVSVTRLQTSNGIPKAPWSSVWHDSIVSVTYAPWLSHVGDTTLDLYRLACTATHCITLQHAAARCNTLQHNATHYNTLQHTASHSCWCLDTSHASSGMHCNTLHHAATQCNTLHHTAPHRTTLTPMWSTCTHAHTHTNKNAKTNTHKQKHTSPAVCFRSVLMPGFWSQTSLLSDHAPFHSKEPHGLRTWFIYTSKCIRI